MTVHLPFNCWFVDVTDALLPALDWCVLYQARKSPIHLQVLHSVQLNGAWPCFTLKVGQN